MIDPKDLRIGNYFKEKYSNDILIVEHIEKDRIGFNGCYPNEIWQAEPIELTEEWLEKLGIKWDIRYQGYNYGNYVIYNNHKDGFRIRQKCVIGEYIHKSIKYVHQLQNLFYSLTGQELTLKS